MAAGSTFRRRACDVGRDPRDRNGMKASGDNKSENEEEEDLTQVELPEGDSGLTAEEEVEDSLDDCDWEELLISPLRVRFTQEKIHPFFFRRGPIVNVVPKIRAVPRGCDDPELELVAPFAAIRCLRKGDELWSLDNRRLYALQLAAMDLWPKQCVTRVLATDRLPRRKLKTQWRKFQTQSEGRAVHVCARYQQFDNWSWFDRAVEIEWYYLSQRLGTLLSVFEIVPVIGALLYRTGLTGFTSRVTYLVAFGMAFTTDLVRQKVPAFERGVSSLQVKAILDGDLRPSFPCGGRFRQAKSAGDDGDSAQVTTAPQVAAMMFLILVLLLPYLLSINHDRLRSSLMSCWLGVGCVLAVQLRCSIRACADIDGDFSGSRQQLTPKHRE